MATERTLKLTEMQFLLREKEAKGFELHLASGPDYCELQDRPENAAALESLRQLRAATPPPNPV